ncbi:unnamed protein product, partial [marine sediment metagenome]
VVSMAFLLPTLDSPCDDLPDIQDPRVSIRPIALPMCVRVRRFYAVTTRAK